MNKLKLFFECGIPRSQDAGTPLLLLLQIVNLYIISIAMLENVPPDAGLHKRATFSTLIVGPAGTGDRTRATCVASLNPIVLFETVCRLRFLTEDIIQWQNDVWRALERDPLFHRTPAEKTGSLQDMRAKTFRKYIIKSCVSSN
jgi:hypothetical protein